MAQGFSLKDQLFNRDKVRYLAALYGDADPGFDADRFEADVMARLPELELKQRIAWIADCLAKRLPDALPEAARLVRAALPPPLDPSRTDDDFGDFIFAPVGEAVVALGIEADPDLVLDLLEEITQRFSMEWAIRPMLNRWPDRVLARMRDWVGHPSYHVRRLVSEGTRPRLPWGQAVALDVTAPLPLLDALHADPTRYVTRSVANHLNDIARKDPDLVLDRLSAWRDAGRQRTQELDWMMSHALRGLVRDGDDRALAMLGYDPDAPVRVTLDMPTAPVRIGDVLTFGATVAAETPMPVLVDYRIHFPRPGGSVQAKLFKLKQGLLRPGTAMELVKRHRLRGDATTYRLVPGKHLLDLRVNGRVRATGSFDLVA